MKLDLLEADIVLYYLKTTYSLNKQIDFDTGSHVYGIFIINCISGFNNFPMLES